MATKAERAAFIEKIAPLIVKYAAERGYKCASAAIAQACLESSYGLSKLASGYHNYFGLKCGGSWKGASVNMRTMEEYTPGTLTPISDFFRAFSDMEQGVKGYFDFLEYSRYKAVRQQETPEAYLTEIKAAGYATSSAYVVNNMNVVRAHNLTEWDKSIVNGGAAKAENDNSVDQTQPIARKVTATCYARAYESAVAGTYVTTADLYCRNDAGKNKRALCLIPAGTAVQCYGYYNSSGGVKWLYIQFTMNGTQYTGFSSGEYLKKTS